MTTDCCTPSPIAERANPPGLPALRYRLGTWSSFRRSMVGRLPAQGVPPEVDPAAAAHPLAALKTRAATDETVALIDAWACACDVLTFYQERILNESYLTTATETRSVSEIARSIGYEPDPGVAASTTLSFTIDPQAPGPVLVPAATPVLSVPAQDEQAQTFETGAELEARAAWNELRARPTRPQVIDRTTDAVYLAGVNTRLSVGDPIVVVGEAREQGPSGPGADLSERWDLRFVVAATPVDNPDPLTNAEHPQHTRVELDHALGDEHTPPADTGVRVLTFRERGGLFGWNAPDARLMSAEIRNNPDLVVGVDSNGNGGQWRSFGFASDQTRVEIGSNVVDLDREYTAVVPGGWVCLHSPKQVELYSVLQTNPAPRAEFSLTARVTRVFLDGDEHLDDFNRRGTSVLLASEELPMGDPLDETLVSGFVIELDRVVDPLPEGRTVLVSGRPPGGDAVTVLETMVVSCATVGTRSVLTVMHEVPPLERDSVVIHANVVEATHGETVADEVLGSGNASLAFQSFALRQAPLTWVAAPPTGSESTLELRVGGVLWERVDTLFVAGPLDRVYTLDRDSDDHTVVGFGDGIRGARPSSGQENVRGTYRRGIGLAGEIGPDQLTLLRTRPPGLRGVTNPVGATGAADPAGFDEIRRDAPRDVLTLGRLVSLQDYEDFASSYPGVGKAKGASLWDGRRSFVHLTVASTSGQVLPTTHATVETLVASVEATKDPAHRVLVSGHSAAFFGVDVSVLVDPARLASDVTSAVVWSLVDAFSFPNRQFAQPVFAAEVVEVVQNVEGVVAVDLDHLYRVGQAAIYNASLEAAAATWDGVEVTQAELLLVSEADIVVSLMDET